MKDQREHWAQAASQGALASVIDPADTRGSKNLYIAQLRDRVFERELSASDCSVLDFGCGSGNLSKSLASKSRRFTGVDISPELLELAVEQNDPSVAQFVLYNGNDIPFDNHAFDFVVSYVVLNHIVDDRQLVNTLANVRKTLKKHGKALFVEQTRKVTTLTYGGIKNQRSVTDFKNVFELSGFSVQRIEHVRKARYLPIYLIRYGLIPEVLFPLLACLDNALAKVFGSPRYSYVDTLFVLSKNDS